MSIDLISEVSVVIPTIGRDTLYRSVQSALEQTVTPREIIICADTLDELHYPQNPIVTVLRVGPRAGGNAARSAGVRAASGEYVALLDDDDYWDEDHLSAIQDVLQEKTVGSSWVASCRVVEPSGNVYPSRLYKNGEDVFGYLFTMKMSPRSKGALMTPTLVFPKRLMLEVPWRPQQRFHQDLTWFLDLLRTHPDLKIVQVAQPNVILGDPPGSVSKSIKIDASVQWAREELLRFPSPTSKRAFADFLLARYPGRNATRNGTGSQLRELLQEALRDGRPSLGAFVYFAVASLRFTPQRRTNQK